MKPFILVVLSLNVSLIVETISIILWLFRKDQTLRRNKQGRLASIIQLYVVSGALLVPGLSASGFAIAILRSRKSYDLEPWVLASQSCVLALSTSFDYTLTRAVLALKRLEYSKKGGSLKKLRHTVRTYCIWPVVKCTAVILNIALLRKSVQDDVIWSVTCLSDTACRGYKEGVGRDVVWQMTRVFIGVSCLEYAYHGCKCIWLLRDIQHRWEKSYIIIYCSEARGVLLFFAGLVMLIAGSVDSYHREWGLWPLAAYSFLSLLSLLYWPTVSLFGGIGEHERHVSIPPPSPTHQTLSTQCLTSQAFEPTIHADSGSTHSTNTYRSEGAKPKDIEWPLTHLDNHRLHLPDDAKQTSTFCQSPGKPSIPPILNLSLPPSYIPEANRLRTDDFVRHIKDHSLNSHQS